MQITREASIVMLGPGWLCVAFALASPVCSSSFGTQGKHAHVKMQRQESGTKLHPTCIDSKDGVLDTIYSQTTVGKPDRGKGGVYIHTAHTY